VFPKYFEKSFLSVKKGDGKDFVFFKYSANNGNVDDENEKEDFESEEQSSSSLSEEPESKHLLLKKIELMFENSYFYVEIEKMFLKLLKDNKMKNNFLYTQVLDERFNFGNSKRD
jgi:hypothetical protein